MKRVSYDDPFAFGSSKRPKATTRGGILTTPVQLKSNLEMQESGESLELLDEFEYLMVSMIICVYLEHALISLL
jgi:hypothetical protein